MARHLRKSLRANLTHRYNLGCGLKPKREVVQVVHCGLERPVTLGGQHLPFFQRLQYNAVRFHPGNLELASVRFEFQGLSPFQQGSNSLIDIFHGGGVMTRELRMGGQALYYGMNALSHNVIMADRKKLKSANGMYLGSTGSGKSFAAKRELINVFLATSDRIVIVDPMGEYSPLVRRLGGQVIEIAPDSPHHINPMDIQMGLNDEDSPLSMKADFLLSLCELVVGGKDGLQPIEKTVIDRCVRLVYRELALGLEGAKMPLLQDLYEELLKQPEPEAKRVATALELYCTGSLNLFNHPTNVDLSSRVVCIVLKGLGENLRKIAMHVTNEFVTSAVHTNYQNGAATWCYFDEFHILLRDPLTASYFVAVWKMLRKKGCVPSALTQNVKDLLASREIENILDNTDFLVLLSQAQSDRAIIAKQLGISEHQLSYITHSNSGEGLLFYGNVTIPFVDRFPKGEIYNLLTTRPEDIANDQRNE